MFVDLSKTEGIIPALETAHAIAHTMTISSTMRDDSHIVINCSGRGDKDVDEADRLLGLRQRGAMSPWTPGVVEVPLQSG